MKHSPYLPHRDEGKATKGANKKFKEEKEVAQPGSASEDDT
jgi:hypothetical protein